MIREIRKEMSCFVLTGLTAMIVGCNTATDIEQRVDDLYNKMSQPERIAQLRSMYMDTLFTEQGTLDTALCRKMIPCALSGSVFS